MLNSFLLASLFPWDFIRAVVLRRLSSIFFFFFPSWLMPWGMWDLSWPEIEPVAPWIASAIFFFKLIILGGVELKVLIPGLPGKSFFLFFWSCYMASRTLVLLTRDQTQVPVEAMSSNHWAAKEVPSSLFSSSPAPHSNWHFYDSNLYGVMGLPTQIWVHPRSSCSMNNFLQKWRLVLKHYYTAQWLGVWSLERGKLPLFEWLTFPAAQPPLLGGGAGDSGSPRSWCGFSEVSPG